VNLVDLREIRCIDASKYVVRVEGGGQSNEYHFSVTEGDVLVVVNTDEFFDDMRDCMPFARGVMESVLACHRARQLGRRPPRP
jgi:hypothetical protein